MKPDGLDKLIADGKNGIEGGHGILKDNGYLLSPEFTHLFFRPVKDVLPVVKDLSGFYIAIFRQNTHYGICGH